MVREPRTSEGPERSPNARGGKCVLVGTQAVGKVRVSYAQANRHHEADADQTHLMRAFARCHPEDVYYPRREAVKTPTTIMMNGKAKTYWSVERMQDELLGEYIPTKECTEYLFDGTVNDQQYNLSIWDTPCTEGWTDEEDAEQKNLRVKIYPQTNVFLICFEVCSPTSLREVKTKWLPEVRELAPDAHVVLLGMKTELRDDTRIKELLSEKGLVPVTHEDGERVAREIGATRYLEGTVIDRESVVRVLEAIVGLM